jgi:hypothetical protein
MPHRILLIWHTLAYSQGWLTAAISSGAGVLGGAILWAFNAEGWSAAIGAIGLALAGLIVRCSPAVAQAVRDIGPAVVDVLKYKRDQMASTTVLAHENASAIQDLQAELIQTRQRAEAAELQVSDLKKATDIGREGREKDRDILHGAAMEARSASKDNTQEIAELKARLASLESRSNDPDTESLR